MFSFLFARSYCCYCVLVCLTLCCRCFGSLFFIFVALLVVDCKEEINIQYRQKERDVFVLFCFVYFFSPS